MIYFRLYISIVSGGIYLIIILFEFDHPWPEVPKFTFLQSKMF